MAEHDAETKRKLHIVLHNMACVAADAHLHRRRFTHKDWAVMIEDAKKSVLSLFPAPQAPDQSGTQNDQEAQT